MKNISFILSLVFVFNSLPIFAESDPFLVKQKEECAKKADSSWDSQKNLCTQTKANKIAKNEDKEAGNECLQVKDLKEREQCFLDYARNKTGNLNNQPEKSGLNSAEAIITHAYTALSIIQMISSGGESNCTSKTIFGATSMIGSVADIYQKIKTKKKLKELEDKYKIETDTKVYDAQLKALEFLKEEQETLADIAAMEKKRNMVMMAGYGAALGFAIYESFTNPTCSDAPKETTKVEPEKPAETAPAPEAKPAAAEAPKPESDTKEPTIKNLEKGDRIEPKKIDSIKVEPLGEVKDIPKIDTNLPAIQAPKTPKVEVNMFTGKNGKTYVNFEGPDKVKYDVVGSKVFTSKGVEIGRVSGNTILNKQNQPLFNISDSPTRNLQFHKWQPPVAKPSGWKWNGRSGG